MRSLAAQEAYEVSLGLIGRDLSGQLFRALLPEEEDEE